MEKGRKVSAGPGKMEGFKTPGGEPWSIGELLRRGPCRPGKGAAGRPGEVFSGT